MEAQLAECLPVLHEALGLIPQYQRKANMVVHTCNPNTWDVETGG